MVSGLAWMMNSMGEQSSGCQEAQVAGEGFLREQGLAGGPDDGYSLGGSL